MTPENAAFLLGLAVGLVVALALAIAFYHLGRLAVVRAVLDLDDCTDGRLAELVHGLPADALTRPAPQRPCHPLMPKPPCP